jgi:D-beta-D-heptose 7-phosphate kinase/D-beta-D-heptose 1-phosphate adenosyltransferase
MTDSLREEAPASKIIDLEEIGAVVRGHRIRGEKIVFTNGCFDLLHAGHLQTLRQASQLGEVLVVGINSDASVRRIKGQGRPIIPEPDRLELVAALGFVRYVVVFEEDTPQRLIEEVRPDVLVKGEDWEGKEVVGEDVVKARGGTVRFVKQVKGISTSNLIKKIKEET